MGPRREVHLYPKDISQLLAHQPYLKKIQNEGTLEIIKFLCIFSRAEWKNRIWQKLDPLTFVCSAVFQGD